MIQISYTFMVILISVLWLIVRALGWAQQKHVNWKRELQLLLVYICIIVVTRFTFCLFGKVDGKSIRWCFTGITGFRFGLI